MQGICCWFTLTSTLALHLGFLLPAVEAWVGYSAVELAIYSHKILSIPRWFKVRKF